MFMLQLKVSTKFWWKKEQFLNAYTFSNHNSNKFILLLQKDVYPYEYVDKMEKFNETSLSEKGFYAHLNMEDITDADYAHGKIFKDKKLRRILWLVCLKRYIIVSWCIWELSKYGS